MIYSLTDLVVPTYQVTLVYVMNGLMKLTNEIAYSINNYKATELPNYLFIYTVLIERAIHNSMCSNALIHNYKRYTQLRQCKYVSSS